MCDVIDFLFACILAIDTWSYISHNIIPIVDLIQLLYRNLVHMARVVIQLQ